MKSKESCLFRLHRNTTLFHMIKPRAGKIDKLTPDGIQLKKNPAQTTLKYA